MLPASTAPRPSVRDHGATSRVCRRSRCRLAMNTPAFLNGSTGRRGFRGIPTSRRFRGSNHAIGLVGWAKRSVPTRVVFGWARGEERAFALPTDWFHGIDPPARPFGRGPDIACFSPSLLPPSRTARQPHPLIRRGPAFLTCRHPSARQHAVIEILIGAACLAKAAGLMFHHGTLSPLLFE
jgi:hypothetical protein